MLYIPKNLETSEVTNSLCHEHPKRNLQTPNLLLSFWPLDVTIVVLHKVSINNVLDRLSIVRSCPMDVFISDINDNW